LSLPNPLAIGDVNVLSASFGACSLVLAARVFWRFWTYTHEQVMPTQLDLSAEPRSVFGKHVRRLRRQGIIPANIYGHGASRAIQASSRALERLLSQGGRTGVVTIAVDGHSETALLKTMQRDPRSGQILHVDFQAVSME